MTRTEIALDRLQRHAGAVYARRQRSIAQARGAAERARLTERRDRYVALVTFELTCIHARIGAREAHLAEMEKPARLKKRWR